MKVLVTGHRGYIGSVLVPLLLRHGHEVTGCDTGLFEACAFVGEMVSVANLGRDIRDLAAGDLAGFDAIVHLAGLSNDPLGDYRPSLTFDINHRAAVRLARHAARAGVARFLFASSCSVYGAAGESFLHEDSPCAPVTPYGVSKAAAEKDIDAMASAAFSPVRVRCGTVYGVSPRIRFDLVLNNLVAWAMATGMVRLKSDGTAWRPVVHVEDAARACLAIIEAPRETVHGQVYNIGQTGQNFRVIELARAVERVIAGVRVEFADGMSRDTRNYRVCCDKLAAELPAWEPRWSVEDGIEELVEALACTSVAPDAFEGERFSRIAHVMTRQSNGSLDENLYPLAGR